MKRKIWIFNLRSSNEKPVFETKPTMSIKPTFILVPGNFLPASYFNDLAKRLESRSFPTQLVSIPSTGSSTPLSSNGPDIAAVKAILEPLVNAGKEIVIVGHSYGSIPMCEAAKGIGKQERVGREESGGIVKLIFVAAWLLQEGESPPAIIGKHNMDAPWVRFDVSGANYIPYYARLH